MRIAHNPNTGEYIGEINGKWEPLRVAKNDAGDMMYFDTGSGKWSSFNAVPGVSQKIETPNNSELSWADVPGEMLRNAWPSAKRIAGEMVDAILSPKETAKTLANTVSGIASKAGITDLFAPEDIKNAAKENEKYPEAIAQYVKDSYGSPDALKQKLAKDPAGAFSDALLLTSGIGGGFKGASKIANLTKAADMAANLNKAGDVFLNASRVADPLYGVSKGFGALMDKAYGREMTAAQRAYLGQLKPSIKKYTPEDRIAMAQTAIENHIPITTSGYRKAAENVRELNSQVDAAIDAADAAGRRIDPERIARNALYSDSRRDIRKRSVPETPLRQFDDAVSEYYDYHIGDNTVRATQETKKATDAALKKLYAANAPAVLEGDKLAELELAHQQRQAIADAVPEVRDLNRLEGTMIDLRDNLADAINRHANHNSVFKMGPMLSAIMTGAATNDWLKALLAGAFSNMLATPGIASRAAFTLDNLSRRGQAPWLSRLIKNLYVGGQNNSVQQWYDQVYNNRNKRPPRRAAKWR